MAIAFSLMAKKELKYISPETAESMAKDYEIAEQIRLEHSAKAQQRPEVRAKKSKSMKGKNAGPNNGMYGKETWSKTHSPYEHMTKEAIEERNRKAQESLKGRIKSEEECKNISKSKLGYRNPMSRFRRRFREVYPDYDYLKDKFKFFDEEYEYYRLNGKFRN